MGREDIRREGGRGGKIYSALSGAPLKIAAVATRCCNVVRVQKT